MAGRKPDLYRWDKFSKPRVYSRTQKVTSNNDIQDWIKKVEEASDNAAAAAFGKPAKRGTREARVKVEDAQLHDAAYAEAQDLLQQWVDEKLDLNDTDLSFESEPWAARSNPKKSPTDIKREWDNLIADNDEDYGIGSDVLSPKTASERSKEVYSRLLDEDSDRAVEDILRSMLDKDVVSDRVTRDLGLNDKAKHVDPTTKMALRHQQVKENREKREAEKRRRLQEAQAKKEAQLNAKRMIQREESEKESRRKREESEIQREMAKIRKEMMEDQRRADDQKRREKQEDEKERLAAEAELQRQKLVEAEARKQIAKEDIDRQRKIAWKIQEAETRNTTLRLRLLHKYFGAWYSVVADRRLQLGKARAMADWKLTLQTWRAWRAHVVNSRTDQDTHRHLEEVKELQRRKVRAEQHYRTATLRRCFAAWLLFVSLERRGREVKNEQKLTKNKMAAFLEAAASGSLWSKGDTNLRKSMSLEDVSSEGPDSTRQRVEDMFSQPARPRHGSVSARSVSSSRSTESPTKPPGSASRKPTQAWQVTRKHLKLTKDEIANLTQGQGEGEGHVEGSDTGRSDGSRSTTSRASKKPWEKKYVVNSTEHRTAAQSKILEQQQAQIKEQQRLIEELTYLQKQQMLQTQLTQQQLLQQQAPGAPPSEEQTKLEKHLKELQASLVEKGASLGPNGQPEGLETTRSDSTAAFSDTNQTNNQKTDRSKSSKKDDQSSQLNTDRDKKPPRTDRTDHSRTTSGESTTRTVSSTNSKHVNFLKSMEDRAAERSRLKAERDEKRRKAEEEKLALLAAKAEEARAKEEEEKQRKAEEYREKKRLDRQREMDRQKEAERLRELNVTIDLHRQRGLLKFRGWRPWQRLMEIAHNRQIVADQHYKAQLLRKVLLGWHHTVREEVDHKEGLADHMHRYLLTRRSFTNWRRIGECVAIQEEKAGRFFTGRLTARVFTAWRDYTEEEKVAMWHKERKAREHNPYRLKKKVFSALRRFPKTRKADEERERRRAEMRKKVASMLPDYDDSKKMKSSVDSDVSGFFS